MAIEPQDENGAVQENSAAPEQTNVAKPVAPNVPEQGQSDVEEGLSALAQRQLADKTNRRGQHFTSSVGPDGDTPPVSRKPANDVVFGPITVPEYVPTPGPQWQTVNLPAEANAIASKATANTAGFNSDDLRFDYTAFKLPANWYQAKLWTKVQNKTDVPHSDVDRQLLESLMGPDLESISTVAQIMKSKKKGNITLLLETGEQLQLIQAIKPDNTSSLVGIAFQHDEVSPQGARAFLNMLEKSGQSIEPGDIWLQGTPTFRRNMEAGIRLESERREKQLLKSIQSWSVNRVNDADTVGYGPAAKHGLLAREAEAMGDSAKMNLYRNESEQAKAHGDKSTAEAALLREIEKKLESGAVSITTVTQILRENKSKLQPEMGGGKPDIQRIAQQLGIVPPAQAELLQMPDAPASSTKRVPKLGAA